jgi:hypothetical protein
LAYTHKYTFLACNFEEMEVSGNGLCEMMTAVSDAMNKLNSAMVRTSN